MVGGSELGGGRKEYTKRWRESYGRALVLGDGPGGGRGEGEIVAEMGPEESEADLDDEMEGTNVLEQG